MNLAAFLIEEYIVSSQRVTDRLHTTDNIVATHLSMNVLYYVGFCHQFTHICCNTGSAKIVKKVQRPRTVQTESSKKTSRPEEKQNQSVAELANSYAKAMSRNSSQTTAKGKAKSSTAKKGSSSKVRLW